MGSMSLVESLPPEILALILVDASLSTRARVELACKHLARLVWTSVTSLDLSGTYLTMERVNSIAETKKTLVNLQRLILNFATELARQQAIIARNPRLTDLHIEFRLGALISVQFMQTMPQGLRHLAVHLQPGSVSKAAINALIASIPNIESLHLIEKEAPQLARAESAGELFRRLVADCPNLRHLTINTSDWSALKAHPSLELLCILDTRRALHAQFYDSAHPEPCIQRLLEWSPTGVGFDGVRFWDGKLYTSLAMSALQKDRFGALDLLVQRGLNINAPASSQSIDHSHSATLLQAAVFFLGRPTLLMSLIERGADVTQFYRGTSIFYGVFSEVNWEDYEVANNPLFPQLFGAPWLLATQKYSGRQLLTSNGTPVGISIVLNSSRYKTGALLSYIHQNSAHFGVDLGQASGNDGCNGLHHCHTSSDLIDCLNVNMSADHRDFRGLTALDCLARRQRAAPLSALLFRLPSADFAARITPHILSSVVLDERSTYNVRAVIRRIIAAFPQSPQTWADLVKPAIQLTFRRSNDSYNIMHSYFLTSESTLVRSSEGSIDQIATFAEESVFGEFDIIPYIDTFPRSEWTFSLPLLTHLTVCGEFPALELLVGLAKRRSRVADWLEAPNSPGQSAIAYANSYIARANPPGSMAIKKAIKVLQGQDV